MMRSTFARGAPDPMSVLTRRRRGYGRAAALAAAALAGLWLGLYPRDGAGVEVPPASGFYIQTGGPNTPVGIGDWYSADAAGAGSGYHYVTITVPCGWPSGTPIHVDLFSPEMNRVAGSIGQGDEPRNDYDFTEFEVYGPSAEIGPGYDQPGAGTGIPGTRITYAPGAPGVAETWVRHATLDPATCGTYVLRSAVLTTAPGEGDDDNGWRLRVGSDSDGDPNSAPPANSDDPDGMPGTNDEIVVGQVQITYQQSAGGVICLTLHQYVAPDQPSATFHNFDMDGNNRVRYYAPSDAYDASGLTGGTAGTLSSDGQWNNGTIARAGDTIADPEAGWWRIVSCLSSTNQFIQEGQAGAGVYYAQPPTPVMSIGKTDGASVAPAGGELTYQITVTNTSTGPTAGAAHLVVVTDAIPTNTTFTGCTIVPPDTGSCSESSSGVVTATLGSWIDAGATARVEVTVTVDNDASGSVINDASVAFADVLGNPYPAVAASDTDSVGPPVPTPDPDPTPAASVPLLPDTGVHRTPPTSSVNVGLLALMLVAGLGATGFVIRQRERLR
jgi:uncharacterized repeat protein (TIGR01451 family)